jgi:catechol 2,3-dioxygenase-like lactoylglutathione lyase family enzyme
LAKRGGCWFGCGAAHIHLGVEQDFQPARKAHPALLVDDLDGLVARLAQHGCTAAPGKPLAGYKRADIADPFGNRIELMQRV